MADVFRAAIVGERGTSRPVAVKRLKPTCQENPALVELFVREAQLAVRLTHPNVMHALELIRDEQGYALVCEWLEATPLCELAATRPLPAGAVVYLGNVLGAALGYLHTQEPQLLHRDVTPANVLVLADGQIKLADFGIACCPAEGHLPGVAGVGTPGFAAPEQLAGGAIDPRADLFGLGQTLLTLTSELPKPLGAVLRQLIATDPAARPASAAAFLQQWQQAASECGVVASPAALCHNVERPAAVNSHRMDEHLSSLIQGALQPTATATPTAAPQRLGLSLPRGLVIVLAVSGITAAAWFYGMRANPVIPPLPTPQIKPASPPLAALPPPPPPAPLPPPAVLSSPHPLAARARPSPIEAAPSKRLGVVSLNAIPWAAVSLDGRPLGNTPLKRLELNEGRHVLLLVHPPRGLRREVVVEVSADSRETLLVDLQRGTVEKHVQAP